MRAWRVHELGEPADVLRLDDVPEPPPPEGGDVVITVEAVGLNFPDVLLCRGMYQERPPLPFTPGIEVAGTVLAAGPEAGFRPGQRVLGWPTLPGGGLAERTTLAPGSAYGVPEEMPAEVAAAFFITYQTGEFALHRRAALRAGETLLVHAGAGGVGSAAIQLGKAAGARVIATAGGAEKVAVCRRLGADLAVDYRSEDFVAAVKTATDGRGADVVFDPVGGDVFDASRRCVAFEGRIVVVGFAGGRIAEAPTNHALIKNYAVVGLHWGLYRSQRPSAIAEAHEALLSLYTEGRIDPLIGDLLPLEAAPEALTRLADRRTVGKLVLRP